MDIQEEFRAVAGFEGKYEVSNLGRVKSLAKHGFPDKFIAGRTKIGYMLVGLYRDNKPTYAYIHRLVAAAFLAKPEKLLPLSVNHIDGNKANNLLGNLEWATHRENMDHAMRTGLSRKGEECTNATISEADVLAMRELYKTKSSIAIADQFGLSRAHAIDIIRGRRWKHLPVLNYEEVKPKRKPRSPNPKRCRAKLA
jgi:hypothetical protein